MITSALSRSLKITESGIRLIRFEEKRESYLWVYPESILFVKSADHYVKTLIQFRDQKKWTLRHCTMKELSSHLRQEYFIRLNRFYIINRNYFSHADNNKRTLYLKDGFSVDISHSISSFMLNVLMH